MPQPEYFTRYANFALTRDEAGVVVVRLHTDDGPLVFTGRVHHDFPALLEEIALDPDNRVMVLTGTGDAFIPKIDGESLGDVWKPGIYQRHIRREGIKTLQRLIDLPIPVIGVANGPTVGHSEYLLLSDIHIASETATYADVDHPSFGVAGGDGVHVAWEEVAGTARAKWLLWTGESIDAATALEWGVVAEVLPPERVLERGIEIAHSLATRPPIYLSLQKEALNLNLRRRINEDVPTGMAYEGLTAADGPYQADR